MNTNEVSFWSKYKFTLISLLILVLAIIPLIVLSRQTKKTAPATGQQIVNMPTVTPTPQVTPIDSQNVDSTLNAGQQTIQSALDQSNTDTQTVNQIDSSSDNVTGL